MSPLLILSVFSCCIVAAVFVYIRQILFPEGIRGRRHAWTSPMDASQPDEHDIIF